MPELLWKAFIDFEIEQQEYDRARKLYNKLLKKTQHVKVSRHSYSLLITSASDDLLGLAQFGSIRSDD